MKQNQKSKIEDQKLEILRLHVSVDDKEILHGITLTINPGEVHVVMGPNGGGKSTLTQALMGHPRYAIKNPNSKIAIDGKNILEMSPDERARAGLFLAFQYPVTIPGVSVQNFLWRAYQTLYPETTTKVLDFRKEMQIIAQKLGIDVDLLKRSLNDGFSGGEKKRVEILQMLLLKPKFVMLDEIDSGLDIDAIRLVADGISTALDTFRPGILVITHYQRILTYLKPSFVHVLLEGKIALTGGMEVVEQLEKSGYTNLEGL